MCGIVGYIGNKQAAPILLDGLDKLEYRGYDSAGIAVLYNNKISSKKSKGRLSVLKKATNNGKSMPGKMGIGHTRWATHGVPSSINAHPQFNKDKTIAVVHNGIIENYEALKANLEKKGYQFVSDTDTEVIAHMLDYYKEHDPLETITHILHRIEGSYALGIMFKDSPNTLYAARKNSPLILGKCKSGNILASDVPAVIKYTRDVIYLEDKEIAEITTDTINVFNLDSEIVKKKYIHIDWDVSAAKKGEYKYFMFKEILEQPISIKDTIAPRIKNGVVNISESKLSDAKIKKINNITIVACGSSNHVGHTAKYIIEDLAKIKVDVELASEFRYKEPIVDENTLVIAISQSGETADTLEAVKKARKLGCQVLSIVNVVGSSIARESDYVLYTHTGPEIAVATTKAYSAQLALMYLLAIKFAKARGKIKLAEEKKLVNDVKKLPNQIKKILEDKKQIQKLASRFTSAKTVFFMGRGIDYAISMEGSLKLKEIAYIHSEPYAAGELKHGTLSLVEKDLPCVVVLTQKDIMDKTLSNAMEVKARKGFIVSVCEKGNKLVEGISDYIITIPKTNQYFTNSLAIIPLQLLSYFVCIGKLLDPDHPRHLAKSVTTE